MGRDGEPGRVVFAVVQAGDLGLVAVDLERRGRDSLASSSGSAIMAPDDDLDLRCDRHRGTCEAPQD